MEIEEIKERLQHALLRWFGQNGRKLPWRNTYDPYHVYLSEIMLQQTQIKRGVEYWKRWLEKFPSLEDVAASSIDDILQYWEGLGYYARARNLHKAAKIMVHEHSGEVPGSYNDLLSLPGIGPYTASAIASIAFNHDIPLVDANVEHVFARIFDIDKDIKSAPVKEFINETAQKLLVPGKAREFNQALMDLGGTICTPKNVQCCICPISGYCLAYQGNCVDDRPIKKASQKKIHIEMATGLLVKRDHIFIQQRLDNDIWGGLWEFPGGRVEESESPKEAVIREFYEETKFNVEVCQKITTVVHFYTKYKVTLHCYRLRLKQDSLLPNLSAAQKYHWVKEDQLDNYGFPAGHRKCINYIRKNLPEMLRKEC